MSIDYNSKAILYKITYIKDGRYYIGISYGKNPCHLKRFKEHLKGKGSVYIKKLLDEGASKSDFIIEVLYISDFEFCHQEEIKLASLWPEGLNGNKGDCILQTQEARQKRWEKIEPQKYEIAKKIQNTLSKKSKEEKDEICEKIKQSMIKYRKNETSEKKEKRRETRISNNILNPDREIKRGISISKSKKGKGNNHSEDSKQKRKETMQNKTKQKKENYKKYILSLSEEEFIIMISKLSRYKYYEAKRIRKNNE